MSGYLSGNGRKKENILKAEKGEKYGGGLVSDLKGLLRHTCVGRDNSLKNMRLPYLPLKKAHNLFYKMLNSNL